MNLTPLHNGRPGIRTLIQIQIREPKGYEVDTNLQKDHGDADAGQRESADSSEPNSAAGEPSPLVGKYANNSCLAVPEANDSCLDFVSSTATLDRYQEIIDPAGWRLEAYRQNPVFQNAHNYGDILFTLGKALITEVRNYPLKADGKAAGGEGKSSRSSLNPHPATCLYQRIQFATDVNPIARIAYGLYKGGFLNAVSVGFIPIRWEDPASRCSDRRSDAASAGQAGAGSQRDGSTAPRRRYLEQELLEVSAVAIPANPEALALAVKSGAVTKADLADTLDLLRSLTVDYGPWRRPEPLASLSGHGPAAPSRLARAERRPKRSAGGPRSQLSTSRFQLVHFARELRRILRRA